MYTFAIVSASLSHRIWYRIALGTCFRNISAFLSLTLAVSYRKLFVPPSCGVAMQGLFHCVLCFEMIIETPFDFTPQRCNTTGVPIAYRADNFLANVGGHLGGKMEHQSRFHIGGAYGFVDVTMSIV